MSAGDAKPVNEAATAMIEIDGQRYQVDPKRNLLEVALEQGLDLPYFCWHPELGSVGACRQCAVTQFRDENDTTGRVVMACMTPCSDKTRVSIEHADAAEMREAVIELLMTNHPHDCPVCEEGGQCHLQDMTLMSGHNYRRYRYTKRTHVNQDLGPFVGHEMNRCISCYRCVRFYREYAGGDDLNVFSSASNVYFGRAESGTLESPFSGNLAEVCPTGVFTDKTYSESYTRKWDLAQAPSICAGCSTGCNTMPGERYGAIKRIENRYNSAVNGYFLCDRGRYGYQHANAEDRPRSALLRGDEATMAVTLDSEAALAQLATWVAAGRVVGVGSPRASLEANHALRSLVGKQNFHRGTAALDSALDTLALEILENTSANIASVADIEQADAVLILGEDLLETSARLALAVRQSTRQASFQMADKANVPRWQDHSVRLLAQDVRSPLFICTPDATDLDDIAARTLRAAPQHIAALGQEIVHQLDYTQPRAAGLSDDDMHLAHTIAETLKGAQRPLIISGSSSASAAVLQAAANLCTALTKAGRTPSIVLPLAEANSLGTAMLGGADLDAALARIEAGEIDTLVVVENNLYRRVDAPRLGAALKKIKNLVVIDSISTPLVAAANLVLPAGSFAEADGTLVNFEGRAQRYFRVMQSTTTQTEESWRWLQKAASRLHNMADVVGEGFDALTASCAASDARLADIVNTAPGARFRIVGNRIPRQSHRSSGRTAMHANRTMNEPRPVQDHDSPLAFSMEGQRTGAPPSEIPIFWAPKWNSNQAVNKFQAEIGGPLKGGDPGVRLIKPKATGAYYERAANSQGEGLQQVWLYELFGSEELSVRGPAIAGRVPAPYVVLNPETAKKLGFSAGTVLRLDSSGQSWQAQLRVSDSLPAELIGVPRGVPGVPVNAIGAGLNILGSQA